MPDVDFSELLRSPDAANGYSSPSIVVLRSKVAGDTANRLEITADGKIKTGDGTAPPEDTVAVAKATSLGRTPALAGFHTALSLIPDGEIVSICALGDSLTRQELWSDLERQLAVLYNSAPLHPSAGQRYFYEQFEWDSAAPGDYQWFGWDYAEGTWDTTLPNNGPGNGSLIMASGDVARHTFYGDGVEIFYTATGGGDAFQVLIDGVEAVAAHSTASGYSWKSSLLEMGPHTVEVVSGGDVVLNFAYLACGNHNSGVRLYNLGEGGRGTEDLLDHTALHAFIGNVGSNLTIYGCGTNDGSLAGLTDNLPGLAYAVAVANAGTTNTSNAVWCAWESTSSDRTWWEPAMAWLRATAAEYGWHIIDSHAAIGAIRDYGTDLSIDDVHPTAALGRMTSELALPGLTGRLTPRVTSPIRTGKTVTANSYAVRPEDDGGTIRMVTASANAVVLPADSPVGMTVAVIGAVGQTELTAGFGGTLLTEGTQREVDANGMAVCRCISTGVWAASAEFTGSAVSTEYDIDDIAHYALGVADSLSGLGDGNPVTTWTALAGPSPTQASADRRPIWRAAVTMLNGQPAVDFDGTDDLLSVAGTRATPYTSWVLGAYKTDPTGNSRLFATSSAGTTRGLGVNAGAASYAALAAVGEPTSNIVGGEALFLRMDTATGVYANGTEVASGTTSHTCNGLGIGSSFTGSTEQTLPCYVGAWGVYAGDIATHKLWAWMQDYMRVRYAAKTLLPSTVPLYRA